MLSANEHGTRKPRIRQAPYGDTISRLGARGLLERTIFQTNSLLTTIIVSGKDIYKTVAKLERSLALKLALIAKKYKRITRC
jgi:hypothetical protein